MRTFTLYYLPTGRAVNDKEGNPITVQANTERGAKNKLTRRMFYVNWDLHAVQENA